MIKNKFFLLDDDSSDILREIKKALTINNNILFEEDSKLIFVEGITDCNYLTAMKKMFEDEFNHLYFIPINGLGKNSNHQDEKIKSIIKIWNKNPIILTDSDKPAQEFCNKAKNTSLKTIKLEEIDPEFKNYNIENLFSKEDSWITKDKNFENSSTFKNYLDSYHISNETKKNFKKVLEYLKQL